MKYGVTNGTRAQDWVGPELTESDLAPYFWPSDADQLAAGVRAVFLGHYLRWDPYHTFEVAKNHGFKAGESPKTGLYAFADIDDEFLITIHHWLKWYKFGFTRLWDNLSLEVRNGRMSRETAIQLVNDSAEGPPEKEIADFCAYLGITEKKFFEVSETFRNQDIWEKDSRGHWKLRGFLISEWSWE